MNEEELFESRVIKNINRVGIFLIILSVLSLLGENFFLTDLLSNFRFQYAWLFLILLVVSFFQKKFYYGAAYLVMCLINLSLIYSTWSNIAQIESTDIKIYYANILTSNKEHLRLKESIVKESIVKETPDIIVLQEVNQGWVESLNFLTDDYKYKTLLPRENNFGMAIFSKEKILNQQILEGKAGVESILFEINFQGRKLSILSTHPVPPINLEYWRLRNNQYLEVSEYLNNIDGEKVLIGDFNTTPWSSYLKQMAQKTNLKPVNVFEDTWNSSFPVGMRIRLDHAFISKNFQGNLEVLEDIGSDHLPMILSLKYKGSAI